MFPVPVVALVTVKLATDMPVPENVKTLVPLTKFVFVPTIASDAIVAPCAPLDGVTEAITGVPMIQSIAVTEAFGAEKEEALNVVLLVVTVEQ